MAKVVYSPGIDYVSGSLAKPKKKEGHRCGSYLIGTHRVAPTTNPNCTRLYVFTADNYARTTQPSADELDARERFGAVSAAVALRRKDLSHISQDQIDFLAQKDTAGGKKTMTAYLWKVCGDIWDEAHPGD